MSSMSLCYLTPNEPWLAPHRAVCRHSLTASHSSRNCEREVLPQGDGHRSQEPP